MRATESALRAVLDQLTTWQVVTVDARGHHTVGPAAPTGPHGLLLLAATTSETTNSEVDRGAARQSDEGPDDPAAAGTGVTPVRLRRDRMP